LRAGVYPEKENAEATEDVSFSINLQHIFYYNFPINSQEKLRFSNRNTQMKIFDEKLFFILQNFFDFSTHTQEKTFI
jgi:hypothetical protein